MITTIIRTLNRPTLENAVASALRESFNVIIVSKETILYDHPNVKIVKMHRNFCPYNHGAINLGAYLSTTDFINILDDDDEFVSGAGNIYREATVDKNIGIWIPGLKFKDRSSLCLDKKLGVSPGNIACPMYRVNIFENVPFRTYPNADYTDFFHVAECFQRGIKVDWFEKELILVRPKLIGDNGRGK